MFKRIIYENWVHIIPIASFVLTFATFIFCSIRAWMLDKRHRAELAALPLAEETVKKNP